VMSTFHCHVGKAATTDVHEIYEKTKNLAAKMKKSGMPGFLHLKYYRYLEHVGVNEDFKSGYRSKKELMPWLKVDPIKIQRETLLKLEITEKEIAAVEKHINAQIEKSIAKAQKDPFPKPKDIFEDIYV
jgi:TPP-dependent pyruvate/acetoin dehydrogenase alpha subunit